MEFTILLTIITEINTQLIRSIIYHIITESEDEPLKFPLIKLVHIKMTKNSNLQVMSSFEVLSLSKIINYFFMKTHEISFFVKNYWSFKHFWVPN